MGMETREGGRPSSRQSLSLLSRVASSSLWRTTAVAILFALLGSGTTICLVAVFSPYLRAARQARYVAPQFLDDASVGPDGPRREISVFVLVTSRSESRDRRDLLRPRFAKSLDLLERKMGPEAVQSVVIRFVLGEGTGVWRDYEASKFKDMVFVNCPDADPDGPLGGQPSATTLKVMHGIAWAVAHYSFEYLFRMGDDAYCRIDYFRELVAAGRFAREKLLLGYMVYGNDVTGLAAPYPSGMGFVLTFDICSWIAASSAFDLLLDTWPEDAIVGRWLSALKIEEMHYMTGFHDYVWHMCSDQSILIHKLPRDAWDAIDENGLLTC